MAAVAKNGTPSIAGTLPNDSQKMGPFLAGEDIAAGDAVYLGASGMWFRSNGSASAAAAEVDGFAANAALTGQRQPLTAVHDTDMAYFVPGAQTPGTYLYLSATVPGGLDTATNAAQANFKVRVLPDGRIRTARSY